MGKSRGSEKNSSEYFKSIIRGLKKEIKQLRQQLHKSQNNIGLPDSSDDEIEEPQFITCSKCGKGVLNELSIANRIILSCSICDYRKVTKVNKDKP